MPAEPHESRPLSLEPDLDRVSDVLRPLGSPVRLGLLRFLTTPHYLEEVASYLRLSRQAALKHLNQLLSIGVIDRRPGARASGRVTEYVVNLESLFLVYDHVTKLASLRPSARSGVMSQTLAIQGAPAEPDAARGPSLIIVSGFDAGARHPLRLPRDTPWLIGRDARCDVPVPYDPYLSNRHAEIRLDAGRFALRDLGSTNGTQHNWTRMPSGRQAALRHGDVIGVGKTHLLFWEAAPVPAGPLSGTPPQRSTKL